jgi:hypothetical protein
MWVPAGVQALLVLPVGANWSESGRPAAYARGVTSLKQTSNDTSMEFGSGIYRFLTTILAAFKK